MTAQPDTGKVVSFPPLQSGDALATHRRPPDPPDMEPRVAALEVDMKDVKAVLARMEPLLIRIDERTSTSSQ